MCLKEPYGEDVGPAYSLEANPAESTLGLPNPAAADLWAW